MIVKFLKDHKHTFKTFKAGDVCEVFWQFGRELIDKKVATDKLSKSDLIKIEKEKKDGK